MRGLAAAAAALAAAAAVAQPAAQGPLKARPCAVCHGPLGISTAPDAPHLAGQPRRYLEAQLRDFRAGKRRHEVMNVIAKPLTDDDIAEVAQWYASIVIEAREPRQ